MKKIILLSIFYSVTICLFGQSKINLLANRVKKLDKTWKLKIGTLRKSEKGFINGEKFIGYLVLTKDKEEIDFCIYQSTNKKLTI
jgi:hypothetical protein